MTSATLSQIIHNYGISKVHCAQMLIFIKSDRIAPSFNVWVRDPLRTGPVAHGLLWGKKIKNRNYVHTSSIPTRPPYRIGIHTLLQRQAFGYNVLNTCLLIQTITHIKLRIEVFEYKLENARMRKISVLSCSCNTHIG